MPAAAANPTLAVYAYGVARTMTDRQELRAAGRMVREALGLEHGGNAGLLPGLGDLKDEMLFGRLWSGAALSKEERMLATLAALTTKQHLPQLAEYTRAALKIGMEPQVIGEVMLHCAIYSGLPTLENSLEVVARVCAEKGVPMPDHIIEDFGLETLMDMGVNTMRTLHAEEAERGYAAPDSAASDLYYTAIQYLYGAVWNRPGPTVRQRMICSIASFTAAQLLPQLRKWLPSALNNVGLTREEILAVIAQTGPYSGFPPALNALVIADEVLPKTKSNG